MIELDNIELILDFLKFSNKETYYYLQILQRNGQKPIQKYSTLITQDKKIDIEYIKSLCRMFTARAYISIIPRSLRKFTKELSKALIERVVNDVYVPSTLRLPDSVALSPNTIEAKSSLWMFDVDDLNIKDIVLEKCKETGIEVQLIVPSFQGVHIIIKPFNPKGFEFESIIKKESNTILFGCKS